MAKHMDSIIRNQIQFWIESGKSTTWIARELGKHPSTIWRELLNHRNCGARVVQKTASKSRCILFCWELSSRESPIKPCCGKVES